MRPFAGLSFRSLHRVIAVGLLMTSGCLALPTGAETQVASGRMPKPLIDTARGDKCVESPAFMRRNHMELLKHQRDGTVHGGIRTTKYSLKSCIECHASQTTGSVAAASTNFCQSCHAFTAVKIDCFECHSSKPASTAAQPRARPSQSTLSPGLQGTLMQKQGIP